MTRVFKLRPTIVHERFGDETVIVNLDSGSYFSAQGSADMIWALIVAGASEAAVLRAVDSAYSGDGNKIARVTVAFLEQMIAEGILEAIPASDTTAPEPSGNDARQSFAPPSLQKYSDMEELLQIDPIHEVDEIGWPSTRKPPV